mgnify:CR=1 FL=1
MSKMSIRKRQDNDSPEKKAAIKSVLKEDDYLTGPTTNCRVDLDTKIHKALKSLGASTSTDDSKAVSMRMLITEAILDMFDKYENKEGKYNLDEKWSWTDRQ